MFSKKPGLKVVYPKIKIVAMPLIHLRDHIVKNGVDSTVVYPCVEVLVEREQRENDLECHDFFSFFTRRNHRKRENMDSKNSSQLQAKFYCE